MVNWEGEEPRPHECRRPTTAVHLTRHQPGHRHHRERARSHHRQVRHDESCVQRAEPTSRTVWDGGTTGVARFRSRAHRGTATHL